MTSFVDRLDQFVRWFFDSSPTTVFPDRQARQLSASKQRAHVADHPAKDAVRGRKAKA